MRLDQLRGRIAAANSIFITASNELGAFESGMLAALVGTVPLRRSRRHGDADSGGGYGPAGRGAAGVKAVEGCDLFSA